MSAVQIFLTDEAAVLFSDGVTYDNDNGNVITAITAKTHLLPHLSCVITSRGPTGFSEDLAPRLGRTFSSFEDLVDNLALSVEIAWENAPEEVRAYGGVEIYAIGWSHERGRAEAYIVTNAPAYGGGWHAAEITDYAQRRLCRCQRCRTTSWPPASPLPKSSAPIAMRTVMAASGDSY